MIELPFDPAPSGAEPYGIDFGFWLTPASGAEEQRVDRKGGRFGAKFTFPPMKADVARVFVSRLLRAHFGDTLKIDYPLLDISQGSPGTPAVAGAGQSGTSLAVDGLTPNYTVKEGFWLTLVDENGRGYLHNATATVRAASDGTATLSITPALRWPFADGATILLARPTIEGKVPAEPWSIPVNKLVQIGFTLEEVA